MSLSQGPAAHMLMCSVLAQVKGARGRQRWHRQGGLSGSGSNQCRRLLQVSALYSTVTFCVLAEPGNRDVAVENFVHVGVQPHPALIGIVLEKRLAGARKPSGQMLFGPPRQITLFVSDAPAQNITKYWSNVMGNSPRDRHHQSSTWLKAGSPRSAPATQSSGAVPARARVGM